MKALIRLILKPFYTVVNENIRFISISTKVLFIFIFFITVSNFTTNYLNMLLNRTLIINLTNSSIQSTTFDIASFANIQKSFLDSSNNLQGTLAVIESNAKSRIDKQAIALGVNPNTGQILFTTDENSILNKEENVKQWSNLTLKDQIKKLPFDKFEDQSVLDLFHENVRHVKYDSLINFSLNGEKYIGSYQYSPLWDIMFISAYKEEFFNQQTEVIFNKIALITVGIIIVFAVIGVITFSYLFRFLKLITQKLIVMNETKELKLINMRNANNDDITFLGLTFNSLSQTISSLLSIFTKFTSKEVVIKAYEEGKVELKGHSQNLTCLFSDIRSFTTITEILKVDIVQLLNIHYDYTIKEISDREGIIASIIGDAVLAVFGVLNPITNKSYDALLSGFKIQESVRYLRQTILSKKQSQFTDVKLTKEEEIKIKALLLEVGVGIDEGTVFYGNIGSLERMTNTVIGDSVNSAARLEGLTRMYKVPIVCSETVRLDIENNVDNHGITFLELDNVKVKGKNIGRKIFWPVKTKDITPSFKASYDQYNKGLHLYYDGEWEKAEQVFNSVKFPAVPLILERIVGKKKPEDWTGAWNMESK